MRILARNYHAPSGEIDLIARDGDRLVFVEVKTRRAGVPSEAVTPEKQRRLTLAASISCGSIGRWRSPSRFDIVSIVWPEGRRAAGDRAHRECFRIGREGPDVPLIAHGRCESELRGCQDCTWRLH